MIHEYLSTDNQETIYHILNACTNIIWPFVLLKAFSTFLLAFWPLATLSWAKPDIKSHELWLASKESLLLALLPKYVISEYPLVEYHPISKLCIWRTSTQIVFIRFLSRTRASYDRRLSSYEGKIFKAHYIYYVSLCMKCLGNCLLEGEPYVINRTLVFMWLLLPLLMIRQYLTLY